MNIDLTLKYDTPIGWAEQAYEKLDEFLQDHADAERKVSNMCMSLIAKYPNRTAIIDQLTQTAIEELLHFKQVYQLMETRGIELEGEFKKDPYIKGLSSVIRGDSEDRFLDRLIIASIAELRGVERFKLMGEVAKDEDVKKFYTNLYKQEKDHVDGFIEMALEYFPENEVKERVEIILQKEAEVTESLPWRPALH